VTGCGLADWSSFHGRGRDSTLPHHAHIGSGAHPASYPVGIRDLLQGVNLSEHEAGHLSSLSADVNNVWSCMPAASLWHHMHCL
jgi:hypothetical protein